MQRAQLEIAVALTWRPMQTLSAHGGGVIFIGVGVCAGL